MDLRDAYVPSLRVRLASDIASLCAFALLFGLLGSALTWWDRSALFDLAESQLQTVKIGTGFLAGPVMILIAMPLVLAGRGQVALVRFYRTRLALTAALWLAGLVILVAKVSALDGYTLRAGTYVSAGLLVVGLAATVAMWPSGLSVVGVNRKGLVRELTRR
jgi:hypothetical protein